jgi:hypothetical protein
MSVEVKAFTINGARYTLTPPNIQTTAQTFDFFSADHVRPVATIEAPAAITKLIQAVDYVDVIYDSVNTPRRWSAGSR